LKNTAPKNVVLVGVSEGAITAVQVAGKMTEVSHIAIIGDGGYSMRKSLTTLRQNGKTSFDVNAGWKKIEQNPNSIEDSWYGNPYRWWSEIMDYDPMPDYMKLNIPILLGIGENDSSVPVESAYHLESEYKKAGKSNLTVKVYKGSDHRLSDGDKSYRSEFFMLLSRML
jgi:dienelactone hydrolase